eukprot:Hpha_TRINITY_DN9542_c0_g2::TRINITY_DN9542_c0_g2_i1::g.114791::m.114791
MESLRSGFLEVCETGQGGESDLARGLQCREGLLRGETVFDEKPQVSVAEPGKEFRCCDYCQRSLLSSAECASLPASLRKRSDLWPLGADAPVRCGSCAAEWCSRECEEQARVRYHEVECGEAFGELSRFSVETSAGQAVGTGYSGPFRLALRMLATVAAAVRSGGWEEACRATAHPTAGEAEGEMDVFRGYSAEAPPGLDPRFADHAQSLERVVAALGARAKCEGVPQMGELLQVGSARWSHLVGVALCNCLSFACNPKHIFFRNLEAEGSSTLLSSLLTPSERGEREGEVRGVGLYPVTSLVNHGCRPTCGVNAVAHADHGIRIVCVSHVPPAVELRLNYLEINCSPPPNPRLLCTNQNSRSMRRARLQRRWGFDCDCPECAAQLQEVNRAVAAVIGGAPAADRSELLKLVGAAPLKPGESQSMDGAFDAASDMLQSEATRREALERLGVLAARGYQPAEHMLGCAWLYAEFGLEDHSVAERHLRRAGVLRRGDEVNAAQSWGVLAELLDALGKGTKVEKDALLWAAARQGYAGAQATLAEQLVGSGDDLQAWFWAEAAASQGMVQPQYLLGVLAAAGRGVWDGEPNVVVARRWLQRAAKAGVPEATAALSALPDSEQTLPGGL